MEELLPLKFRLLQFISTVEKACANEILTALEPEYGNERQFKKEAIIDYLLDLKASFIIDDNDAVLDSKGELVLYYSINDEGKKLLKKYLPKRWQ